MASAILVRSLLIAAILVQLLLNARHLTETRLRFQRSFSGRWSSLRSNVRENLRTPATSFLKKVVLLARRRENGILT